jgi:O-antigen ligase
LQVTANLRTRAHVERLWTAIIWSSAPVVLYGLVQALGLDPLAWHSDAAAPVLATIGRANFLGATLVLMMPLTWGRARLGPRRWPCRLLLAGQVTCLVMTQARGAWLGLSVSLITGYLGWAKVTHKRRAAWRVLVALVVVGGCLALLNLPDGPLASLARRPGFDRLATLGRIDSGSVAARLTIWQATLPLIAARPALGYGPETMREAFAPVSPPQLVYYQGRHTIVDRAHNLWLDLGMSAGLAGVITFAALLIGTVRLLQRGLKSTASP